MKTRQQAAEDTVSELKARYLHDEIQDIDDLGVQCFLAGCDCSDREHREFYGLVMEYLYTPNEVALNKIYKHLASFTEREQPKD